MRVKAFLTLIVIAQMQLGRITRQSQAGQEVLGMMKAAQGNLVEMTLCRVAIGNKSKGIGWKRGVAMFHRSAASTIQESRPIRMFSDWTRVAVHIIMGRLPANLFPLSDGAFLSRSIQKVYTMSVEILRTGVMLQKTDVHPEMSDAVDHTAREADAFFRPMPEQAGDALYTYVRLTEPLSSKQYHRQAAPGDGS
ncbi:uncharacterized protein CLUP02_01058 [Colletotrichum lupini]|uniref:Uncharacterized protein n=1 Tax=Colletotrichum lupini TaxID=145971 RepID=A0A9Q8W893_9PEZI|nr:uncharacterized protein CLUP02_01058 [Colletotrichum lupini]UQC74408.1 hypothetical protein CLUP02_01058 [Colletotrichum lupini]